MDCGGGLPTSTEFMNNLYRKASEQRIPMNGSFEITHRCNLRCKHCYLGSQDVVHANAADQELDTKTICKIIDEITTAGCLQLLITGGEPLVRKDFLEIYQHAAQSGLIIRLFTNGTLISDKIIKELQAMPPRETEITLYGATAETYENVTGVPGSYKRCMQGIEKLLAAKIPLKLKTMLLNLNQHEFHDMEQFADNLGLGFRYDSAVQPCLNGDKAPLTYRVTPDEIVAIDFADKGRCVGWQEQYEKYGGVFVSDKLYNCGAGRMGFHIDPCGNLMPCMTAVHYKYNLLQGSFEDGWNNFIPKEFLAKLAPKNFGCQKCPKQFLCNFCPAFFYLENESETERSEYLCQIGHQRYQAIQKHK